ncbi:hypothetical protein SAMN04488700_1890 [Carnobacterium iners]|uniref:Uncharacterized protein n=1 Tax=Carnobacterium iners TaxID=1073423 RepID=A0A1X7NFM2_9LACT|nr:hypothetical protein [Carnobacterium iners]SEK39677.1 hypothetical protein SAMN04488114_103118 [Carnobacterium iners]SMH36516.1 hypothetical protein SAMN04488700_1890 [Carnobacterium iners]
MLSFEEKKALFDEYKELTAVPVSLNRTNYHFESSAVDKTTVVRYLHQNGNALIYAGYLPKEETIKGYISVLDADEKNIRRLLDKAIIFLKKTEDGYEEGYSELWFDQNGDVLRLVYDNPMWSVNLPDGKMEAIFKTKEAAEGYLLDEAFFRN